MAYRKDDIPSYELMPDWKEKYEYEPRKIFRILLQSHVGMKTIMSVLGKTRDQLCFDLGFYTSVRVEGKPPEKTLHPEKLTQFIKQCRASGRATLQVWTYCQAESSLNGALAMRAEIKRRGDSVGAGQVSESVTKEIATLSDEELLERFQNARKREETESTKLKRAAKAMH